MEFINSYLGKYDGSVFLNHGKYCYYLNHNNKLYSVPVCFQKPTFKLEDAIKIIEFKKKMKEKQIENKNDFQMEPKGTLEDHDDEIKPIKKSKSKK